MKYVTIVPKKYENSFGISSNSGNPKEKLLAFSWMPDFTFFNLIIKNSI